MGAAFAAVTSRALSLEIVLSNAGQVLQKVKLGLPHNGAVDSKGCFPLIPFGFLWRRCHRNNSSSSSSSRAVVIVVVAGVVVVVVGNKDGSDPVHSGTGGSTGPYGTGNVAINVLPAMQFVVAFGGGTFGHDVGNAAVGQTLHGNGLVRCLGSKRHGQTGCNAFVVTLGTGNHVSQRRIRIVVVVAVLWLLSHGVMPFRVLQYAVYIPWTLHSLAVVGMSMVVGLKKILLDALLDAIDIING